MDEPELKSEKIRKLSLECLIGKKNQEMNSEKLINAKATKLKELKELGSIRWREKQNIVLYLMCI
jgi:hypothetical protein